MRKFAACLLAGLMLTAAGCGEAESLPTRPPQESAASTEVAVMQPIESVEADTVSSGDEGASEVTAEAVEKTADVPVAETSVVGKKTFTVAYYNPYGDILTGLGSAKNVESDFERANPGYDVKLVNHGDKDDELGLGYTTRMTVMLMSGDAPDLFELMFLRADKLYDGGFCEDLLPYINADPDINLDDYFPNIISAAEYKGHLYVLPSAVSPGMLISVNRKYADTVKEVMGDKATITYSEMIQCYEAVMARDDAPEELYVSDGWQENTANGYYRAFQMEERRFFDPVSGAVDFGTNFITAMRDVAPYIVEDSLVGELGNTNEKVLFSQCTMSSPIGYVEGSTFGNFTMPFTVENTAGDVPMSSYTSFCINAQSGNKDAAWQFIKYVNTNESSRKQQFDLWSLPANKQGFYDIIESQLKISAAYLNTLPIPLPDDQYAKYMEKSEEERAEIEVGFTYMSQTDYDAYMEKVAEETASPIGQFAARLENIVGSMNYYPMSSKMDLSEDFLNITRGLKTIEQTAENLQEKFTLYMAQ